MTIPAGVQQKFWVKAETTFDTALASAATDAVNLQELKLEPDQPREPSIEHTGTGSLQSEILRKKQHKWSAVSYVMPSGSATTPPDIGPALLKAAMGAETIGGSDVTYSFNDNAPTSLQWERAAGSLLYEIANGAWVEQFGFEIQGNAEPKLSLSGGYASHGFCVDGAKVNANQSAAATSFDLQAGDGDRVYVNALVKFAAEDNGGAGYRITAVSGDTITITPGLAGGITAGDDVDFVVPSQTLAGNIRGGIDSDMTIGGTSIGFISAKVDVVTGIKGLDKEATTDRASAVLRAARREVSFEAVVYAKTDDDVIAQLQGRAIRELSQAIIIRCGPNTAGARMKFSLPAVTLAVKPVEIPDAEEATYTLSGRAVQSASAGDELSVIFD